MKITGRIINSPLPPSELTAIQEALPEKIADDLILLFTYCNGARISFISQEDNHEEEIEIATLDQLLQRFSEMEDYYQCDVLIAHNDSDEIFRFAVFRKGWAYLGIGLENADSNPIVLESASSEDLTTVVDSMEEFVKQFLQSPIEV